MDNKTSTIVMAVILGVLGVGALVLVIVGVVTHKEAGFMEPDARWAAGALPLPVLCESYSADGWDGCNTAEAAVVRINRRLGFEVFEFVRTTQDTPVRITVNYPRTPDMMDTAGHAEIVADPSTQEISRCWVRTSNIPTTELLGMVIEHELGHCLWLAHDRSDMSIMRRMQRSTGLGSFPPRITDHDRRLLRERYLVE